MPKIIIGSRGSQLALRQTHLVAERLKENHPGLDVEIKVIHTQGDKILDVALSKIGDKGLFTKELETALLNKEIDLAVHSLKDVPTVIPDGLSLGAILDREPPADALISAKGYKLADLPAGAVIGTSSLRRRAQLMAYRPDLKIVDLRGNLETRIRKMRELDMDGIILAWAGLARMGLEDLITEILDAEIMVSAAGQGALAVEIRSDDTRTRELLAVLDSPISRAETAAERAFLGGLGGGCQVPIGAMANVQEDRLMLTGIVASLDGERLIRVQGTSSLTDAKTLGRSLAEQALARGGQDILDSIMQE